MRIKTYQGGGIVYLPTVNQIGAAQNTAASSGSSDIEKVPGFTKEVISLIKENGLDSDVTVFLNKVQKTLDLANDPTGENLSMKEILKIQREANRVKQNYASYQTAEKSLESQDAWSEPATTARGWLYVQDNEDGKIKAISPVNYNPNQHLVLTNQDLINLRRSNPEMAFNNDILDNLSSAVGMKTITDYARALIKDFGKSTITGYSEKQAGKIREGMEHIVSGDLGDIASLIAPGPDGLYKISQEATIADSNINAALDYLKTTLPNSYINTLRAKAAAEGYSPDAMLLMMMYSNTDRSFTADYEPQASNAAGYNPSKGDDTKLDAHDTYLMRIATGGEWGVVNIMPNPDNPMQVASMQAKASNVGDLLNSSGKRLDMGNLNVVLGDLEAAKAANTKDITFGNKLLDLGQRGAVMWDGESQLTDIWLPYTTEGGQIKPDFDKLMRFNELNDTIKDNPGISNLEKAQLMREVGLSPEELEYDPNTGGFKFKESVMKMFLSFSAVASDNNLDLTDEDKRWLQKLDVDESKRLIDPYNNAIKYNTIARSKSSKVVNSNFSQGKKRNMYRGVIYMPIDSEYLALHLSTNQNIPKSDLTRFAARTQATAAVNALRNEDLSQLGQFK